MTSNALVLAAGRLTLADLRCIAAGSVELSLAPEAWNDVERCAAVVQQAAAGDAAVYGVNTGFGKLASTRIAKDQLQQLQLNLIRSHSVGVGAPFEAPGAAPDAGHQGGVAGARLQRCAP
jgi:histidine ammonia-lyase